MATTDATITTNITAGGTIATSFVATGSVTSNLITGGQGATGPQGPAGQGVIAGGTTGQVLAKNSNTDYDMKWITNSAAPVTSVAGKTGAVTLVESDIANLTTDLAAKQATGNYITALTGDVTASGPGSVAATLAATAVTPGSYTNANITVDSKGRITSAANGAGGGMTNPMTTLGDIIYENGTPTAARLAGNITTAKQFLTQTGTGTVSAAPAWGTIAAADVPTLNQNTTGTASNVTGTVAIANGGTGQTTQQAAINALAGTQSSGKYLRSDGVNTTLSSIQAADVPTLNQSTTGTAANVTGTVAVANGGTGATTLTGLVKGNGTSAMTAAVSGTDYAPATSGTSILKGNGSGGFSSAVGDTDYQKPITLTTTGTSGAATLVGDTLNIPQYSGGSGGGSNTVQTGELGLYSTAFSAAQTTYGHPFVAPGAISIQTLFCYITAVNAANPTCELGVYNSSFTLLSSATFTPTAAGLWTATLSVALSLTKGNLYHLALLNRTAADTTTTFLAGTGSTASTQLGWIQSSQSVMANAGSPGTTGRSFWMMAY